MRGAIIETLDIYDALSRSIPLIPASRTFSPTGRREKLHPGFYHMKHLRENNLYFGDMGIECPSITLLPVGEKMSEGQMRGCNVCQK